MNSFQTLAKSTLSLLILVLVPGCLFEQAPSGNRIVSGNAASDSGNGAGYGGGDKFLSATRQAYIRALSQLRDGFGLDDFGKFQGCNRISNFEICNALITLTPDQTASLKTFAKFTADQALALHASSNPTPFQFVEDEMTLTTPDGLPRPVSFLTAIGAAGPIKVNIDASELDSFEKLQKIGHETVHKVTRPGDNQFTVDNERLATFDSADGGMRFADTYGAAIAYHLAINLGVTPVLVPETTSACNRKSMQTTLAVGPYYRKPTAEELSQSSRAGGQVSPFATDTLNAIDKGEYTVLAWVRPDTDISEGNGGFRGNYIFNNGSNETSMMATTFLRGISLHRTNAGKFNAYAATAVDLESGLDMPAGVYSLVGIKRSGDRIYTYVNGVRGNDYSALYVDDEDGEEGDLGLNTAQFFDPTNPNRATANFGKAGAYPRYGSYEWQQYTYWKGVIAALYIYKSAITDEHIKSLYDCGKP